MEGRKVRTEEIRSTDDAAPLGVRNRSRMEIYCALSVARRGWRGLKQSSVRGLSDDGSKQLGSNVNSLGDKATKQEENQIEWVDGTSESAFQAVAWGIKVDRLTFDVGRRLHSCNTGLFISTATTGCV